MKIISFKQTAPLFALVSVTAVWGSTFFLIKDLLNNITALDFLGIRFFLAAAIMVTVFYRKLRNLNRQTWKHGLILGVIFSFAQITQTWGLGHTPATISGFITGMYVVLTPIVLWIVFRTRIVHVMWIAVFLSAIGLTILSLHGFSLGIGESVTLISALLYAIHIVFLGRWSASNDTIAITTVQMIAIGSICLICALPGGISLPPTAWAWTSLLYTVVVAGILALFLQTWAQSRISPTRAAIIMTTEPVFAAAFAIALGGEHLTTRILLGGTLIISAMLIAEITNSHTSVADSASIAGTSATTKSSVNFKKDN